MNVFRARADRPLRAPPARWWLAWACAATLWAPAALADETAPTSPAPRPLKVAVFPIAAAVEWEAAEPTGVMVEIWQDLARRVGVTSEFVRLPTFSAVLQTLEEGTADVAIGPVAITEARERVFDLTHPVLHSGLRIAVQDRQDTGFLAVLRMLLSPDLAWLSGILLILAIVSGHLLWLCERRLNDRSFPRDYRRGVWEATWWIASAVVTGGCDDKHVDTTAGRALAFVWMVAGIVLVTALTSVVTATLTAEQVAGLIHGPRDLAGRTVGCQRDSVAAAAVRQRAGIAREYDSMHEAIAALARGQIDAVVSENHSLMYLVQHAGLGRLRLVGPLFDPIDFGLGMPAESPLREPLNTAILRLREDGTLDRLLEKWLGKHE